MRIKVTAIFAGVFMILLQGIGLADSPITSTPFSEAYMDIPIVELAADEGEMNLEIAEYLASPYHPIDVKAAVINALSWDFDGKYNTELFLGFLALKYQMPMHQMELDDLTPDEMFCVGYLVIMDDYFAPEEGIPLLDDAAYYLNDSFTVAIILALAEAQEEMEYDWCDVWELAEDVFDDRRLDQDMREDAVDIIYDYMVSYEDYCD